MFRTNIYSLLISVATPCHAFIYYMYADVLEIHDCSAEFLTHLSWKFSDRLSSVHPSVCPSVYKLFTFSSSYSPEPLCQFQANLAQSILGWREFRFIQMKGHTLFQGEIIRKKQKYIDKIFKSSPEPLGQFQPNLEQSILGWRGFNFEQIRTIQFSEWR